MKTTVVLHAQGNSTTVHVKGDKVEFFFEVPRDSYGLPVEAIAEQYDNLITSRKHPRA